MPLDARTAQTALENTLRDAILQALGKRLPQVATIAALRAFSTLGASSSMRNDDDLIAVVSGTLVASYRWSAVATAADDGVNVIKPADVSANGRWLKWTSPLRFQATIGGDAVYLHEGTGGPLERVIVLDQSMSSEEMTALIAGQVPAVLIEATDDDPDEQTLNAGHQYDNEYSFTVSVIDENLRDRREHAQGSAVSGESASPGANALDGAIRLLLSGTRMAQVVDGIISIRPGRGKNFISELAQRRVIRQRFYAVVVNEEHPAAPNDAGYGHFVDAQAMLTDLHEQDKADLNDYVVSGFSVVLDPGLTKTIAAGQARVDGVTVNYAGQLATFVASSDTYLDLLPNGLLTLVVTPPQTEEPPITPTALRVAMVRTDGSGVTAFRFIAITQTPYMNPFRHLLSHAYEAEVLADNPRLYWRLGEASGTVAIDASGNGRHGTYVAPVTMGVTGLVTGGNRAVEADSMTAQITIADAVGIGPGAASVASIEAWVKPTGPLTHLMNAIVGTDINTAAQFSIFTTLTGTLTVQYGSTTVFSPLGTTPIVSGSPYHLVVTCDGVTLRVYFNGALLASEPFVFGLTETPVTFQCGGGGSYRWRGVFDEFAVYPSALGAARVLAHYKAGIGSS